MSTMLRCGRRESPRLAGALNDSARSMRSRRAGSEGEDPMKTLLVTTLLVTLSGGLLLADKATDERLANAAKAFDEIMAAPDKGIPGGVLDKAACVIVVPGMKKGGFIVGGSFGRGAISCRGAGKKGWGAPAMVELGGGSVGFQIGAEATDVVMLVMNRTGIES